MTPLEALREALAGWRKTKHPRFAAVAQWASARALSHAPRPLVGAGRKKADLEAWNALLKERDVLDLPRLLEALRKMKSADAAACLVLLSKQHDPRVTDGALALLSDPPWRARTALPFFRTCAKVLLDVGDPRVRPALEDLAGRYKSIVVTSVGDDITALLRRSAESLDQVKPGPLPAAWEEKCAALEKEFETERAQAQRGAASSQSAQHADEGLLAAIYAAPEDDAPRLVFADALIERGDPRGEFISLQLNRAQGKASPAQLLRERELCANPKTRAAWSLPLSQGGACHVARGFPDELLIEPRMLKTVIGLPAVRTLKTVGGFERELSLNQAKAFLLHEHAVHLRSVKTLQRELVDELQQVPWEEVALRFLPTAGELARMPKLRALHLWGVNEKPTAQLFAGLGRLEKLMLNEIDAPALAPLSGLRELQVGAWRETINWSELLSGLPRPGAAHPPLGGARGPGGGAESEVPLVQVCAAARAERGDRRPAAAGGAAGGERREHGSDRGDEVVRCPAPEAAEVRVRRWVRVDRSVHATGRARAAHVESGRLPGARGAGEHAARRLRDEGAGAAAQPGSVGVRGPAPGGRSGRGDSGGGEGAGGVGLVLTEAGLPSP